MAGDMKNFSVGGLILDLYDDVDLSLLGASPWLEKVGSLPIGDPEGLKRLEDRQFGVVFLTKKGEAIRKYPLHDYPHVVLANVYFDLTHDKLPPEAKVAAATQIREASALFGVEALESVVKHAADETAQGRNYVRLQKIASGEAAQVDLFGQLKEAYEENRDRYTRADKVELAEALSGISARYGLEIPADLRPFVVKNAQVDPEAFFAQCAARKRLLPERSEATHLLDEFVEKRAEFDAAETVKLLETFDRQFGLEAYWTRGLEPRSVLMEKKAIHDVPVAGFSRQFTDDELKSWVGSNGDLVQKMFGKELAERMQKDPSGTLWELPSASRQFIAARIEHGRDNTPVEAQ